jgi:hypothetical protein
LGFPIADALRELAVTLRRLGITGAQCALGFRVALMLKIGVREESFESFISDVYNRCKDIGLSPQNIASHLADLNFLKLCLFQRYQIMSMRNKN